MADTNFVNRPSESNREWVNTPSGRKKNLAYVPPKNGAKNAAAEQARKAKSAAAGHKTEVVDALGKSDWEPRPDTGIPASDNPKHLYKGLEIFYDRSKGPSLGRDDTETALEQIGRETSGKDLKNPGASGSNVAMTLKSLDLIDDDNELTDHGHAVLGAAPSQRDKTFAYMFSKVPETGMERSEREKMWNDDLKDATKTNRHRVLDNMAAFAKSKGYPPEKRTADGLERTSSAKTVETDDLSLKKNEVVCSKCFLAYDSSLVENGVCADCR